MKPKNQIHPYILDNILSQLRRELEKTKCLINKNFSGVGVLVWDGRSNLPITPLCLEQPELLTKGLAENLSEFGQSTSSFHDGFHVINTDFSIHSVAMYFSPPISTEITWDRSRGFGGRYVAGLFGSCLPGVIASGVLSTNYGLAIFSNGKEVQQ